MRETWFASLGLEDIAAKVDAGERLSIDDGARLFACKDVTAVGALAHRMRTRINGDKTFYVVNRHINYTNICVNGCLFCAYQREDGQEGAFKLSVEDALQKVRDLGDIELAEIHIVGGCHPRLPLSYFEELLSSIKRERPETTLKCFTAVEIAHFAELEGLSTEEVFARLKAAGLEMMPGGGAEIFAPQVRERICPRKSTAEEWLAIHGQAHKMGITTNATMLYGHIEEIEHRLDHLDRLRRLQDETGGFSCFIPLSFQIKNNQLGLTEGNTGVDDLKTIAVSRLMLDNIDHIKAYWIMLGTKLAQTALYFGADDLDGTVVEEKIGHMAGADSDDALTKADLEAMIHGCGFTPVERDARYTSIGGQHA